MSVTVREKVKGSSVWGCLPCIKGNKEPKKSAILAQANATVETTVK